MYKAASYSTATIDMFEVLGGHIISVFYNQLYDKAKSVHSHGGTTSVTDAYRMTVHAYMQHFDNPELFKKTVGCINSYCNLYSRIPTISYGRWVDNVTREFVPTNFWDSLNTVQKDQMVGTIVKSVFGKFSGVMLSTQIMCMLVDDHESQTNITLLQDKMLTIMIEERVRIHQKFLAPAEPADSAVTNRMHLELSREVKKTAVLSAAYTQLQTGMAALKVQVSNLEAAKEWLIERARDVDARHKLEIAALTRKPADLGVDLEVGFDTDIDSAPVSPHKVHTEQHSQDESYESDYVEEDADSIRQKARAKQLARTVK